MTDSVDQRSISHPVPTPDPEFAADTTLVTVVDAFEREGFTAQMVPVPGALVRCGGCHQEHPASEFAIEELRRTEGASDPADMAVVAGVTCPGCGANGTAVLHYGPVAALEESDVLAAFEDARDGSGPPTGRT